MNAAMLKAMMGAARQVQPRRAVGRNVPQQMQGAQEEGIDATEILHEFQRRITQLEATVANQQSTLKKLANLAVKTAQGVDGINKLLGTLDDGTEIDVTAASAAASSMGGTPSGVSNPGGNVTVDHLDQRSRDAFLSGADSDDE